MKHPDDLKKKKKEASIRKKKKKKSNSISSFQVCDSQFPCLIQSVKH